MTAPGWDQVARRISGHAAVRAEGTVRRAAVALLLRDGAAGIELLLIRRAEHEHDPWSGQVGFPGGRVEPEDASLAATAVRETFEEIAIDLAQDARLLGTLDEIRALARMRPVDLVIAPFVFRLLRPLDGTPSHEVVSLHWLPLATLLDPGSRSVFEYRHEGASVPFPCLRAEGLVVWGLTFRMFENFRAVLEATP